MNRGDIELFRLHIDNSVPLRINGAPDADDLLILNYSATALPRLIYDGGTGGNDAFELVFRQNQEAVPRLDYAFQSPMVTDLTINFNGDLLDHIQMIDLEPIFDHGKAVYRSFEFPAASVDQIAFSTGDDPTDTIWRIDSNNSEVVDFEQPSDFLLLTSSEEDSVELAGTWVYEGTEAVEGKFARLFSQGELLLKLVGPDDWSNPVDSLDTNASGNVTPIDVLLVINELNQRQFQVDRVFVDPLQLSDFPNTFLDVNGDGLSSPIDALLVINFLNLQGGGEAEDLEMPASQQRNMNVDLAIDMQAMNHWYFPLLCRSMESEGAGIYEVVATFHHRRAVSIEPSEIEAYRSSRSIFAQLFARKMNSSTSDDIKSAMKSQLAVELIDQYFDEFLL
ncbi:MAG: dockerin type I domain-containing protein [Pirellulaceae bacterium]